MHCFACSSFETSTQQRRRKKTSTSCMKNENTEEINLKLLEFQLNSEPSVVLDQTIVNRYFKAKRVINEILRSGESKSDYQERYSSDYERLNSNNYEEPSYVICNQALRKNSTETMLTNNTLEPYVDYLPDLSISIKDEVMDKDSNCVMFYNDENLMNDAEVHLVEIPFNSNIVLNPMNNRFSFSQVDPSFIYNNEDDIMNGNTLNAEESDGPKYLYNPMNNIVTSTQTNDDTDDFNNNPPNVMPADVQFAPGEYTMEDSFLNDNYNVNMFAFEPIDMEPNQNTLPLMEHSSKEQDFTMPLVNTIVNPDTTSDDTNLPKYDKTDNSETFIESLINEQENMLYNELEHKQEIKTDLDENTCAKCHKKFKILHYLKRHELTCGMTFHYNCLFCAKTSMLSHTIKCHMTNRHAEQVALYGLKDAMEAVIKRRKENKETNMNILLSKDNQVLADVKSNFIHKNNLEKVKKRDQRKQTFSKAISDDTFEIKKELIEENFEEEVCLNLQNSDFCNDETNFKPSKEYVDALCSNCNVYFKNLKSGVIKCCTNCQKPLIYKCAVCRKCFSKYLSICGHVKYHSKDDLCQIVAMDDKHYCGYCNYETIKKSHLLRHILRHVQEKSVIKIKCEYSG